MTDTPTPQPTHNARWGVQKPAEKAVENPQESQPKVSETFTGTTTAPHAPDTGSGEAPVSAGGVVLWALVGSVALAAWWYRKHPGKFTEHKGELKDMRKQRDKKAKKAARKAAEKAAQAAGPPPAQPPSQEPPGPSSLPPLLTQPVVVERPLAPPEERFETPVPVSVPGGITIPVQRTASPQNQTPLAHIPAQRMSMEKAPEVQENVAKAVENLAEAVENEQLTLAVPEVLVPTELETTLLKKLEQKNWAPAAKERGLENTVVEHAELGIAGISVLMKLDNTWTLEKFQAEEASVRAVLALPDDLTTEIDKSGVAGWARLSIRTRLACPEFIEWEQGGPVATCTVTGEPIRINWRRRLLVAGESGSGKSTTIRPWLAEIVCDPLAALIYLDPKRVEAALWKHHARVGRDMQEIYEIALEIEEELDRRLNIMERDGLDKWIPTPEHPSLIIPVDEGADFVRESKRSGKTKMGDDEDAIEIHLGKEVMRIMEKTAGMGRAAEIHLWWMTQYPNKTEGCPPQIAENMRSRVSMTLATRTAAVVVFGTEFVKEGWTPHRLPSAEDAPGRAFFRMDKQKPYPAQVHYMDKSRIKELPASLVWSVYGSKMSTPPALVPVVENPEEAVENEYAEVDATPAVPRTEDVYDTETDEPEYVESDGAPWEDIAAHNAEADKKDTVLRVLHEHGGEMQTKDLEEEVYFSRATLKRVLGELEEKGLVVNARHGVWQVVDPDTEE